jgi:hypothetical protein
MEEKTMLCRAINRVPYNGRVYNPGDTVEMLEPVNKHFEPVPNPEPVREPEPVTNPNTKPEPGEDAKPDSMGVIRKASK